MPLSMETDVVLPLVQFSVVLCPLVMLEGLAQKIKGMFRRGRPGRDKTIWTSGTQVAPDWFGAGSLTTMGAGVVTGFCEEFTS